MNGIMLAGLLSGKSGYIVSLGLVTVIMIAFLLLILRLRTSVIGSINEATTKAVDRFIAPSEGGGGGGSATATSSGSEGGGGGGGSGMLGMVGRTAVMSGTSVAAGSVATSLFGRGGDEHGSIATGSGGSDGDDGAVGATGAAGSAGASGASGGDGSAGASGSGANGTSSSSSSTGSSSASDV